MKEYIRMFSRYRKESPKVYLVSEAIFNKEEAEYFADAFSHNYKAKTYVSDKFPDGGYVVFADAVDIRLIRSNYNEKFMEYTFANFKFEHR